MCPNTARSRSTPVLNLPVRVFHICLNAALQSLKSGVVSPESIFPEAPSTDSPREDSGTSGTGASVCGGYADSVVRKMSKDTGLCRLGMGRSSSVERLQECLQECLPVVAGDSALFKSHYR